MSFFSSTLEKVSFNKMIIVSNGFNKFHLAPAASELERRGLLSAFLTGAYPTKRVKVYLTSHNLAENRKIARFLARREPISEALIFSDGVSESLHALGRQLQRWQLTHVLGSWIHRQSYRCYGWRAQEAVRQGIGNGATLYHYRGGFGFGSVEYAKRHGLLTLCDYSIAHPAVMANNSDLESTFGGGTKNISRLWQRILRDSEQADAVLVNSEYVRQTFLQQGWEPSRVHVIYLGVDDAFIDGIANDQTRTQRSEAGSRLRIVFAGGFELRKGARVLSAAMEQLLSDKTLDFEFHMAGGISLDAQEMLAALRGRSRVFHHGILSRQELAALLLSADIFVFPSLAEGSARVVFEALACGCYVITTPNSGSIVEDGVHGCLVPAGDAEALAAAVRRTVSLGRESLRVVGEQNARIVREQYRQSQYGDRLVALYARLLGINLSESCAAPFSTAKGPSTSPLTIDIDHSARKLVTAPPQWGAHG